MIDITALPALNATLNAVSGILLLVGFTFIRQKRVAQHRACMLLAFAVSTLFLISYVIYHANVGSRPFPGQGIVRLVYFAILIPHIILAAAVLPMALTTLSRGLRGQYVSHVRIARRTFPIWMFVSVTGVIVYLLLYQVY